MEEEDPQEDHQEDPQEDQTQYPPAQTYLPTYTQFPKPVTQKQWGNSLTSSMEIEQRQSHLSTN